MKESAVIKSLVKILDHLLQGTLVLLMAALVVNVIWQVASRYLLGDPSSFTEEVARFLLLWIGLLGGCHAYRTRSHLGLDLITEKLAPGAKHRARGIVLLVTLSFAVVVLIYGGGHLVALTLELKQTSAALGIPMGYVYFVLPLSGLLIAFYSLVLWFEDIREDT